MWFVSQSFGLLMFLSIDLWSCCGHLYRVNCLLDCPVWVSKSYHEFMPERLNSFSLMPSSFWFWPWLAIPIDYTVFCCCVLTPVNTWPSHPYVALPQTVGTKLDPNNCLQSLSLSVVFQIPFTELKVSDLFQHDNAPVHKTRYMKRGEVVELKCPAKNPDLTLGWTGTATEPQTSSVWSH